MNGWKSLGTGTLSIGGKVIGQIKNISYGNAYDQDPDYAIAKPEETPDMTDTVAGTLDAPLPNPAFFSSPDISRPCYICAKATSVYAYFQRKVDHYKHPGNYNIFMHFVCHMQLPRPK